MIRKLAIAGVALLVVALLMVAAVGLTVGSTGLSADATNVQLGVPLAQATFASSADSMVADPSTGALWFVDADTGTGRLTRFDPANGTSQQWQLPGGDYYGMFFKIKIGTDGVVWTESSYNLIKFDPSTQTLTSVGLAQDPAGEMPQPSSGGYTPGTYITSIFPYQGGLIVARNNLPYLQVFDGQLNLVRTVPIAPEDAGAWDIAVGSSGAIAVEQSYRPNAQLALYDMTGKLLARRACRGSEVAPLGSSFLVGGWGGPATTVDSSTLAVTTGGIPAGTRLDLLAVEGALVYGYDAGQSEIYTIGNAQIVSRVALQKLAQPAQAEGGVQRTFAPQAPHVTAFAADSNGTIWYFTADRPGVLLKLSH